MLHVWHVTGRKIMYKTTWVCGDEVHIYASLNMPCVHKKHVLCFLRLEHHTHPRHAPQLPQATYPYSTVMREVSALDCCFLGMSRLNTPSLYDALMAAVSAASGKRKERPENAAERSTRCHLTPSSSLSSSLLSSCWTLRRSTSLYNDVGVYCQQSQCDQS